MLERSSKPDRSSKLQTESGNTLWRLHVFLKKHSAWCVLCTQKHTTLHTHKYAWTWLMTYNVNYITMYWYVLYICIYICKLMLFVLSSAFRVWNTGDQFWAPCSVCELLFTRRTSGGKVCFVATYHGSILIIINSLVAYPEWSRILKAYFWKWVPQDLPFVAIVCQVVPLLRTWDIR